MELVLALFARLYRVVRKAPSAFPYTLGRVGGGNATLNHIVPRLGPVLLPLRLQRWSLLLSASFALPLKTVPVTTPLFRCITHAFFAETCSFLRAGRPRPSVYRPILIPVMSYADLDIPPLLATGQFFKHRSPVPVPTLTFSPRGCPLVARCELW